LSNAFNAVIGDGVADMSAFFIEVRNVHPGSPPKDT
jgi:hypothetical protein